MIDVLVIGGVFVEVLDADRDGQPRFGGSGFSAAVAAAAFGANTAIAGAVGDDDQRAIRALLDVSRVNHGALVATPGPSGTFLFPHIQDPAHPWPLYRPAGGIPDAVPLLPDARVVLVFGIPDYDPLSLGWLAGRAPETLIWDRQGWLSRARDNVQAANAAARRRIYVANARESAADLGDAGPTDVPSGFDAALIKEGVAGVRVIELQDRRRVESRVPAFPVKAETTIGSGDVFAGALAAALARNADLIEATRAGCAAASVSLSKQYHLLAPEDADAALQLVSTAGS